MKRTTLFVCAFLVAPLLHAQCFDFEDDLLPGLSSRLGRTLSVELSLVEEPEQVLTGVTDDEAMDPIFENNPNDSLFKVEGTFMPGRVFTSAEDLANAYATATDADVKAWIKVGSNPAGGCATYGLDVASDPLVGEARKLERLTWSGAGSLKKRFLSSLTFSIGRSERSRFLGRLPIPPEMRGDDSELVFSLKFDPDELFVRPKDLPSAYTALSGHVALHPGERTGLASIDMSHCSPSDPVSCLRRALPAGMKMSGGWLATLLPVFEVKSVDQFDFLAGGGSFFANPDENIVTVTATWDLSTMNGSKNRREAIKALALHQKLARRDALSHCTLTVLPVPHLQVARDTPLTMQLGAQWTAPAGSTGCPADPGERGVPKVTWKIPAPTPPFQLTSGGVLTGLWSAARGPHLVTVEATDEYGRKAAGVVRVTVP